MTIDIALIILFLTICGLIFIIYKLLQTLTNLAKMIKADNLQEYIVGNDIEKSGDNINVGQQEERYADVSTINKDTIKNLNLNPEQIYRGTIGDNPKTETFT